MTVRSLRIVHLFPELLNVYGDLGNIRTMVRRAAARGIAVEVLPVHGSDSSVPRADLFVIGGGQDLEQVAVARSLERLGNAIREQVVDGAAVLAVCGGYQSLGLSYRTAAGVQIDGPGILHVRTVAGAGRLVGPVVASLSTWLPRALRGHRASIVGFENHAGRTYATSASRPLAYVEIGAGNNGEDGTEGILALPGEGGLGGLRMGTYLHGPLLPRNPHLADMLLAGALARGGREDRLVSLDDGAEWRAHANFATRVRSRQSREGWVPGWVHRLVDPPRSLIGF